MKRSAFTRSGACRASCHGMTLLEICMVLFIIMLLLAATMPAIQSAFVEQTVRNDARQLSLMVKTAMIQSGEQHRPYIIELTATTMTLRLLGPVKNADIGASPSGSDTANTDSTPADVEVDAKLDGLNQLLLPDPEKAKAWAQPESATWRFEPGELCPATRVRVTRGKAWVELTFNALTGNTEETASYFP